MTKPNVGDVCPLCGHPPTVRCRCFRADSQCVHGHEWHTCTIHGRTVVGPAPHGGISSSVCTCPCGGGDGRGNIDRFAEADDRTAIPGHDGDTVERLLDNVQAAGAKTIADLTRDALLRLLRTFLRSMTHADGVRPTPALLAAILAQPRLFNDTELALLALQIAKTISPAMMLGRARVRLRKDHELVSTSPANFQLVKDRPGRLGGKIVKPLEPTSALDWFRSTFPNATTIDSGVYSANVDAEAFRMAVTTEQDVLARIHRAIEERLKTGQKVDAAPKEIAAILEDAGIASPRGGSAGLPAYSRAVFRTQMMEAYRHGAWSEFSDPDLAVEFPVWQYTGIRDGRERHGPLPEKPDHRRWFGLYFDRAVRFMDVRGNTPRDVINCRCDFIPIHRKEWERIQKRRGVMTTRFP